MRAPSVALSAALVSLAASAALADPFLDQFVGGFSGTGTVASSGSLPRHPVSCSMAGRRTGETLDFSGTCRAYLLFSRPVGVTLQLDPRSGRVNGEYRGARVGPGRLNGTRTGADARLSITWPKPVYGSTSADLSFIASAPGSFRIVMSGRGHANGRLVDLAFKRDPG